MNIRDSAFFSSGKISTNVSVSSGYASLLIGDPILKYNGETYNIRGRTGLPFKTICGTPLTCRTLQVVFASLPSSTPLEKKLHPHKKNADINATHTEFAFIHQLKTTLGVISIKKPLGNPPASQRGSAGNGLLPQERRTEKKKPKNNTAPKKNKTENSHPKTSSARYPKRKIKIYPRENLAT